MAEKTPSFYNKKASLILKCVLTKSKRKRIKYAKVLLKIMEIENEHIDQLFDMLAKASQTITDQNALLQCFYDICGEERTSIVLSTYKTLKNKKDKRKDL